MIVDQTRNRPSALAFAAATSPAILAPVARRPAFPAAKYGGGRSEIELGAVRQQQAARKNLGSGAHRRRARDRHTIADANRAPVYAAIPQDADRRCFSIPDGLHALLVPHGQEDLSMRVAPRHGLDDAGDFDGLSRIEDTRLTVMRVSNIPEHGETQRPRSRSGRTVACCYLLSGCAHAGAILARECGSLYFFQQHRPVEHDADGRSSRSLDL